MQVIRDAFAGGATEIEDLWVPFYCVSTNLSKQMPSIHQYGSLWQYVRASMTIVGLVPPVVKDGEMLVDGGYLNNLPIDVMYGLGVATVIVVRPACMLLSVCALHLFGLHPVSGGGVLVA